MMKKITILALMLLTQIAFSQGLTENQKLAATCKVWGFLKYYHPKVAKGDFNWDNQLFEILPKIEKANTNDEFSIVLENWITTLGEIKEIVPIVVSKDVEYFDKNFDLSWFNSKLFSKKLTLKLKIIEDNRFQGDQFYIQKLEGGNVFAKNENKSDLLVSEKRNRLLLLFRYWNIIEYFYPYKYLMDNKWEKTLADLLPNFINLESEKDLQLNMMKLFARLNDSHTYISTSAKNRDEKNCLPVKCKVIDNKLVVTKIGNDSLAVADDIRVGDAITKLNEKSIKDLIEEKKEVISASNESFYLKQFSNAIIFGNEKTVSLECLRNGITTKKTINVFGIKEALKNAFVKLKAEKYKLLPKNIGYVNMGEIEVKNIPDMIITLKNTAAIIFDLRNYPKETLYEIADFICEGEKAYIKFTKPDLTYPGRFKWTEPNKIGKENKNNYKGKVIVLLDENSISQSEETAMAFQTAPNITIIGSQTAGADGNNSDFEYIKGFDTHFTGIGVYYPDRRETQRIGIVPDIEVKPTIKGIQEGRDEVLDRALKFIETGK